MLEAPASVRSILLIRELKLEWNVEPGCLDLEDAAMGLKEPWNGVLSVISHLVDVLDQRGAELPEVIKAWSGASLQGPR